MTVQFNVDQALDQLGQLVVRHGPEAVEIAAQAQRVDGINTLTGIVVWGTLSAVALLAAKFCLNRANIVKHTEEEYSSNFGPEGWYIAAVIAAVIAFGFFCSAITALFDVWAWVSIFNPKLALAHRIILRVGG